jgi:hypothetical protein
VAVQSQPKAADAASEAPTRAEAPQPSGPSPENPAGIRF